MAKQVKTTLGPDQANEFQEKCMAFVRNNLLVLVRELHSWDRDGELLAEARFRIFSDTVKTTMGIPISVAMRVCRGYVQDAAFEYIVKVADTQAMMKSVTKLEDKPT